jgi:hypothetical protein
MSAYILSDFRFLKPERKVYREENYSGAGMGNGYSEDRRYKEQ